MKSILVPPTVLAYEISIEVGFFSSSGYDSRIGKSESI